MDVLSNQLSTFSSFVSQQRPSHVAAVTALSSGVIIAGWVLSDYNAWTSFGTGGLPPTWAGYWRMTKIRAGRALSSDDLKDPSPLDANKGPRYLPEGFEQIRREGSPPRIMSRTMPQRQVPYKGPEVEAGVLERVAGMCAKLCAEFDKLVYLAPAKTEGGAADGIYSRPELETLNPAVKDVKNKILAGEVGHTHPSDGSVHVWLSEGDARRVVEAGWGQRFPLAFVDKGWVMVYTPRTHKEADMVESILKAGIGWVCGQKAE
jgi:hypothetical protein